MCNLLANKIKYFKSSLSTLLEGDFSISKTSDLIQSLNDIKEAITIIKRNSERQIELNTLSKSQKQLFEMINELFMSLKNYKLGDEGNKYALWDFNDSFCYKTKIQIPNCEGSKEIKRISELCERIFNHLNSIGSTSNIFMKIYNYLFDSTLGSFNYVFCMIHIIRQELN